MDPSAFDVTELLRSEFREHRAVAEATELAVLKTFSRLVDVCSTALGAGNKLLLFGNGGSAADAEHIAAELVVRYSSSRPAIAAIALTTDNSILTAIGNDFGFEHLFARQIEALGRPGDVAIGISTSGNSPNVLLALQRARAIGCQTAGLSGASGGEMRSLADPVIVVPSRTTARIQEIHILLGHALCISLEHRLGFIS